MKIGTTAKAIESIAMRTNDLPDYYNTTINWTDSGKIIKADGRYIARYWIKIIDLIQDTNAKVKVEGNVLKIVYDTGYATMPIDELVTKILIPELSQYIVTD